MKLKSLEQIGKSNFKCYYIYDLYDDANVDDPIVRYFMKKSREKKNGSIKRQSNREN